MVLPLRQISSPGYSGMAIGGVNKCQDAGYQGTGNGYVGWNLGCIPEKSIVVGYIFPSGSSVVQVLYRSKQV